VLISVILFFNNVTVPTMRIPSKVTIMHCKVEQSSLILIYIYFCDRTYADHCDFQKIPIVFCKSHIIELDNSKTLKKRPNVSTSFARYHSQIILKQYIRLRQRFSNCAPQSTVHNKQFKIFRFFFPYCFRKNFIANNEICSIVYSD
jgi:hypothetical protein